MKGSILTPSATLGLLLCLCASQTATHRPQKHPSTLDYPPLDWQVPRGESYRTTLPNGLRLYIAEDRSLPLVNMVAYLKGGDMLDPVGKEGLGTLACRLIRTGGTETIPSDTLDERLERFAVSLSASISDAEISVNASFLSGFTDTALAVIQQALFHPAFEPERIEREREILVQAIRHRFDEPGPTLGSAYTKVMYPGSPNSRMATEESLRRITREDLLAFHRRVFSTNNMIAAVAGDFDNEAMKAKLSEVFPPSAPSDTSAVEFPDVDTTPRIGCLAVHMPISQAYVRMGLPFVQRPHPDYYAVTVLNEVLGGGGFTSRLATTVRSDEGLTYSIYSQAGSNYTFPATIYINFFTKNETVNRAIELSLREVGKLVAEGITDEELNNAKKVLVDGLPSMFRSSFDIVSTYAWNEYAGRSPDHYVNYPAAIEAITADSVKTAAKKYLDPEAFTFVIVGDTTELFGGTDTSALPASLRERRQTITPAMIPALSFDEGEGVTDTDTTE